MTSGTYAAPTYSSGPAITLPHPYAYTEFIGVRGSATMTASGAQRQQLVSSGAKKRFMMKWRGLTSTNKTTLETFLEAAATASTTFTSPNGDSYTVVLDKGSDELEFVARTKSSATGPTYRDIYFDTNTLMLVEV